jgi:hypothetical protein
VVLVRNIFKSWKEKSGTDFEAIKDNSRSVFFAVIKSGMKATTVTEVNSKDQDSGELIANEYPG